MKKQFVSKANKVPAARGVTSQNVGGEGSEGSNRLAVHFYQLFF